jgi:RNA polymerase sigma-70 factor (ECF subfamily)
LPLLLLIAFCLSFALRRGQKNVFRFFLIKPRLVRLLTVLQTEMSTRPPDTEGTDAADAPTPAALVDALVRQHQSALLGYARSLVRDDAAAQDIVQDTFLRLWKSPPAPAAAKAWLFRVCRSRAIDWWRGRRETTVPDATDDTDADGTDFFERQADTADTPSEALLRGETLGALLDIVAALPPRQRELVRLKFQADLSYKEIADATGLSVTNVGFILHSALAALRQLMTAAQHQPAFTRQ